MNFAKNGAPSASNRLLGLAVVVGLHVLLIWGLINGLARKVIEILPDPIETRIIEDVRPPLEAPPPPMPEFEPPPPPYIPPPDIVIQQPPPTTTAIQQVTTIKPPAPPPPPRVAQRVPPRIDLKGSPRACREPTYPSASERLGEQGTSAISLLIDINGKVAQTRIDSSSGFSRLDEAAIYAFSRCRFTVGTLDGQPEPSWFSIRYKWVIQQR